MRKGGKGKSGVSGHALRSQQGFFEGKQETISPHFLLQGIPPYFSIRFPPTKKSSIESKSAIFPIAFTFIATPPAITTFLIFCFSCVDVLFLCGRCEGDVWEM